MNFLNDPGRQMWFLHKVMNTNTYFRQGQWGKYTNLPLPNQKTLKYSRNYFFYFWFSQNKLELSTLRFLMCETQAGPNMYSTFFCRFEFAFKSTKKF